MKTTLKHVKKDPNAVITKHKGDIKYNKEGEIEYTDQFSKKDTQLKKILNLKVEITIKK